MSFRIRAAIGAIIISLAAVVALSACGGSGTPAATTAAGGTDDALVVYSGREEEYMAAVFAAFEKKTGTTLDIRYGDSADLALLIGEEGDNTRAEAFIAQSPSSQAYLSGADRLSTLPETTLDRVPANLRSVDGRWVGIAGRQRILAYNTDLVTPDDLPASVLDLTTPPFTDKVGVAPSNASFQDFIAAMNQLVGTEVTNSWLAGMTANGTKAYAKNGAIADAVVRGEIPFGLINHYYIHEILEADPTAPIAAYRFPGTDPGSVFLVATASIPTAAHGNPSAIALIDFLLSDEGQALIVAGEGEYPTVPGISLPEDTPSLTESDYPSYDLTGSIDLKAIAKQIRESGLAG
ncbi:MAG: extracellular solute-binding protein [Thermoleophilia bacterium]|nr:extracellular solute-binding protein [Thermoleophilia bacterium]